MAITSIFIIAALLKNATVVTPPDQVDDWVDSYTGLVNTQTGPLAHVQAFGTPVTLMDECDGNPTLAWNWGDWVATLGSWPTTFNVYGPQGGSPTPPLGASETYNAYYNYDREWYIEWWPSAMRDRVTDTFTGQDQIIVG